MARPRADRTPAPDASIDEQVDHPDAHVEAETVEASWGVTRVHRIGLGMLAGVLVLSLIMLYVRRPALLDEPIVTGTGGGAALPARVDPNVASWEELARIPGLGEARAREIVAYRQRQMDGGSQVAFVRIEDLDRVPGIGEKTYTRWRAYLDFPGERPEEIAPFGSGEALGGRGPQESPQEVDLPDTQTVVPQR